MDQAVVSDLHDLGRSSERAEERLRELIALFLDDAETRLRELDAAMGDGDDARVAEAAHTLAGSCGHVGALAVVGICRAIEAHAQAGDLRAASAHVAELPDAFDAARAALTEEFLSGDGNGA